MNIKKVILIKLILILLPFNSFAASGGENAALSPKEISWRFEGVFGSIDKQSVQRGFKIYQEVCSSCHSMKLFSYRNLEDIGFSKDEVKQVARQYVVMDGPNDEGEMFERLALPSDKFLPPYPNEQAARVANGGAYPPDLSLITKARMNGPNYIYSLLTGYQKAPADFNLTEGKSYNPYFEGRQIGMPSPITDDEDVEYLDGTFASKEQMAIDIVNFLQFVAEPETEARKKLGVTTLIFLLIMTILFAIAKRRIWKKVK
ncbi:cytochrome c1 [Flavobacteriaceae bacterium]|nr:cytochrome c1 [Flavobacteriaceae bacterium]